MRVLLAISDEGVARSVALVLGSEGHVAERATSDADTIEWVRNFGFDLILLETTRSNGDGIQFAGEVRALGIGAPIVFLSKEGDIARIEAALAVGDDFVRMPVDSRELIARMNAIVRRSQGHVQAVLRVGELSIDMHAQRVCIGTRPVHFTANEYKLLELLLLRQNKVVPKHALIGALYAEHCRPADPPKNIEVYICRVRAKLREAGCTAVIAGQRHVGYTISDRIPARNAA
jgi:two-component system cell cycle response regulator CtrA